MNEAMLPDASILDWSSVEWSECHRLRMLCPCRNGFLTTVSLTIFMSIFSSHLHNRSCSAQDNAVCRPGITVLDGPYGPGPTPSCCVQTCLSHMLLTAKHASEIRTKLLEVSPHHQLENMEGLPPKHIRLTVKLKLLTSLEPTSLEHRSVSGEASDEALSPWKELSSCHHWPFNSLTATFLECLCMDTSSTFGL